MEGEAGHAVQQLARLTRRRDNLASLVERLSVLDGLSAGAAALGLLLQVSEKTTCWPCEADGSPYTFVVSVVSSSTLAPSWTALFF